jgi:periplasmic divalent cation tolerance protein
MTPRTGPALIWCPLPDADSARKLINTLLDERLVACANILPGMQSLFVWNGERGEAMETGVLLKTDTALLDRAVERITALHPYEQPAVIGWRCDSANAGTLAWLGALAR